MFPCAVDSLTAFATLTAFSYLDEVSASVRSDRADAPSAYRAMQLQHAADRLESRLRRQDEPMLYGRDVITPAELQEHTKICRKPGLLRHVATKDNKGPMTLKQRTLLDLYKVMQTTGSYMFGSSAISLYKYKRYVWAGGDIDIIVPAEAAAKQDVLRQYTDLLDRHGLSSVYMHIAEPGARSNDFFNEYERLAMYISDMYTFPGDAKLQLVFLKPGMFEQFIKSSDTNISRIIFDGTKFWTFWKDKGLQMVQKNNPSPDEKDLLECAFHISKESYHTQSPRQWLLSMTRFKKYVNKGFYFDYKEAYPIILNSLVTHFKRMLDMLPFPAIADDTIMFLKYYVLKWNRILDGAHELYVTGDGLCIEGTCAPFLRSTNSTWNRYLDEKNIDQRVANTVLGAPYVKETGARRENIL
jgi:hypothetical protein